MNCNTVDPELFFDAAGVDQAKAICHACPLATSCREAARVEGVEYGVFGGEDAIQRARWRIKQMTPHQRGVQARELLTAVLADAGWSEEDIAIELDQKRRVTRQYERVIALREEGLAYGAIALRLGIHKSAVVRAVRGELKLVAA